MVREKSGQEILLEQLTKQVSRLTAEQKTKEVIIKELDSQIHVAEIESQHRIAKVRAETETTIATLRQTVQPVRDLHDSCQHLRSQIAQLKQDKLAAVMEVKMARSEAIKVADERVAKAAARLAAIEVAMATCKTKVEAL